MTNTFEDSKNLEQRIIEYLQKGDRQAISLVYANYADALYGLIVRIIRKEEVATELLQDTFIKIWKYADKYDPAKGRLFTWMANIARNTAIDKLRSGKFQRQSKTDSLDDVVYNNRKFIVESQVRDSGLLNVINSLEEKHRLLIDLVYYQDYTQSEIAKEFDIPLGTVKSRLRLAIRHLRDKLNDEKIKGILLILILLSWVNLILL